MDFVYVPSFLRALLDPDETAVAGDGEPLDGPPSGGNSCRGDRRLPGPVRPRARGMHRRRWVAIGGGESADERLRGGAVE